VSCVNPQISHRITTLGRHYPGRRSLPGYRNGYRTVSSLVTA
jgi:hypothetical protein